MGSRVLTSRTGVGSFSQLGMKAKSTPKRLLMRPSHPDHEAAFSSSPGAGFPVVGIGASAGGLEALEQFLAQVPAGCGIGFVIIQHLDPTREGIMSGLLQRVTGMKVSQVKDRTRVRPDCVYVIPPNKNMSILHGVLHLLEPVAARGLRLPIDFFLRSLAQDQHERSIGVVLSGMGSDGTLGLRAIKEKAGLALVQDPVSARFDGMPRSAIDAGLADIVAPAGELPAKILSFLQCRPQATRTESALPEKTQSALEKAVLLLRSRTGHDFSLYKRNTLYRRIERRMGIHQIGKIASYIRYLQENTQELDLLFKEFLIGVTSFFRDPAVWDQLSKEVVPDLLARRPAGQTLRAWVPACSSGEEAYSLAMILKEAVGEAKSKQNIGVQVFATDLDRDAIDKARQAIFPANIAADVSPERLARFFEKDPRGYRVRKEIREMVIFATQNLVMDPPFTKQDILSCRNLLIYLAPELQRKLIPLFHYSLNPDGILLLGSAETIGEFGAMFAPLGGRSRIFRRRESTQAPEPVEFPSSFSAPSSPGAQPRSASKPASNLQALADRLILQRYAPPAVLTNDKGDILYVSGRTGNYLEPAAGKANWNIFAMAREGLRYELSEAFQKVIRQGGIATLRQLKVQSNGKEQLLDVTVQRLEEAGLLQGLVMIVFTDLPRLVPIKMASASGRSSAEVPRLTELHRQLQEARKETSATREAMQTSQEELRSANEEMQSTNEELQSTNEELTTSKEEMQSLNEELQTLNAELQAKLDELSRSHNDMKNLLNSTDIATVFLDGELRVRRFTTQAARIISLIQSDVGRPITDLATELHYPRLAEDAREVLQTLVPAEKSIGAKDGRWFTVRIMPYRTVDNLIDGVVITFADISTATAREANLSDKHASLERQVVKQSSELRKARGGSRPKAASHPLNVEPPRTTRRQGRT